MLTGKYHSYFRPRRSLHGLKDRFSSLGIEVNKIPSTDSILCMQGLAGTVLLRKKVGILMSDENDDVV